MDALKKKREGYKMKTIALIYNIYLKNLLYAMSDNVIQ